MDFEARVGKLRAERRLIIYDLVNEAKEQDGTYAGAKSYFHENYRVALEVDSQTETRLDQSVCPVSIHQDAEALLDREFKQEIEEHRNRKIWSDSN